MMDFLRKRMRPKAVSRAEEVVDQAIEVAKRLGVKTPRECAEMVKGGPLSDEEWGKFGEVWNRRWY